MGRKSLILTYATLFVLLVSGGMTSTALADSGAPAPPAQGISDDACLACHNTPGLTTALPSGVELFITVDRVTYKTSVHGRLGYACVQCHEGIRDYPHPPITADTRREYALQRFLVCQKCHLDKYQAAMDSVHAEALAAGNEQAAVCTDCHGAHDTQSPDRPRTRIPRTCERCHSQIFAQYADSVHGEALLGEGNPDVPTCTDCHGVHTIMGPSEGSFRLFSPQVCAECHADEELMARYGVSTDVFDTYVSDFHGTTVVLFEQTAPDQETNKPVCIDCHGVHNMKRVDDPESAVIKENLLDTCQRCHPDATTNFPSAWLSHYRPSPENAPVVYFANLFYFIIIPALIGGMAIFVVIDYSKRVRLRREADAQIRREAGIHDRSETDESKPDEQAGNEGNDER